jgi:hypothetical protein
VLPLATLLRYGKIRPVTRPVANALYAITGAPGLKKILNARRRLVGAVGSA